MKKIKIVSMAVGMMVFSGCAPMASIENVASKINAAIPAPNDVDYFAKNAIANGCTSGMTHEECKQVKNMQLVNKFVYKANYNKGRVLSMPINDVNTQEAKKWLEMYNYLLDVTTSDYSRKQLKSVESTMDAIEDRFFPNGY